jgi:hypothetical protein
MSKEWSTKQRAAERVAIEVNATLRREGEEDVPVAVANLSSSGCNISCDAFLAIGSPVIVSIPGAGEIAATVAWQLSGRAGLEFSKQLGMHSMIETMLTALTGPDSEASPGSN